MAQGLFPGSDHHWWQLGDLVVASGPRCCWAGCCQKHGEEPGNCAGVGIPAPARAQGHPGRALARGVTSRAISQALVTLPAGWDIPREAGGDKTPKSWGGETPGDSNLSIGRVKAIIFYLQRMAESLVVSGARTEKEKVAMA